MTGKFLSGKEKFARVQEAVHTVLNVKVSGLFNIFFGQTQYAQNKMKRIDT